MTKDELIKAREILDNSQQYHDGSFYIAIYTAIKAIDAQIKACETRAESVNKQMLDALKNTLSVVPKNTDDLVLIKIRDEAEKSISAAEQCQQDTVEPNGKEVMTQIKELIIKNGGDPERGKRLLRKIKESLVEDTVAIPRDVLRSVIDKIAFLRPEELEVGDAIDLLKPYMKGGCDD